MTGRTTQPTPARPILTLADTQEVERRAMSRRESEMFVRCTLMSKSAGPTLDGAGLLAEVTKDEAPFAVRLMVARLKAASGELLFSLPVVLFVTSLCSSPAQVVLWAHYLVTETRLLPPASSLNMDQLAEGFPWGFPTEEGYQRIWDAQKNTSAPCGNLLDGAAAWGGA